MLEKNILAFSNTTTPSLNAKTDLFVNNNSHPPGFTGTGAPGLMDTRVTHHHTELPRYP